MDAPGLPGERDGACPARRERRPGSALPTAGPTVTAFDALATCDRARRKWRLVLLNRHPSEALECTVTLGGKALSGRYRATVLAGDSPDAFNDVDRPDRATPRTAELEFAGGHVALPPHSLTVVAVE